MSDASLSKFITQVITEINAGIVDAITQAQAPGSSYRINPIAKNAHENWKLYEQKIEFDVALSVAGGVKGGVGLGLSVFSAKIAGEETSTAVNRVRFAIPVVFSGQPIEGSHSLP